MQQSRMRVHGVHLQFANAIYFNKVKKFNLYHTFISKWSNVSDR